MKDRCLSIIYNDKVSTFEQLLDKASSVSIHIRNLRFLAVERFADVKSHASTIINDFLSKETSNYNLRQKLFLRYLEIDSA